MPALELQQVERPGKRRERRLGLFDFYLRDDAIVRSINKQGTEGRHGRKLGCHIGRKVGAAGYETGDSGLRMQGISPRHGGTLTESQYVDWHFMSDALQCQIHHRIKQGVGVCDVVLFLVGRKPVETHLLVLQLKIELVWPLWGGHQYGRFSKWIEAACEPAGGLAPAVQGEQQMSATGCASLRNARSEVAGARILQGLPLDGLFR